MTFEDSVLLSLYDLEDGGKVDEIYSGDTYLTYKKAVERLGQLELVKDAIIIRNPGSGEIEVASLKRAYVSDTGMKKIQELKR